MAWVEFTKVFKWSPKEAHKTWSQTFQPSVQNVKRDCADAAIAAGAAKATTAPKREKEGD